MSGSTVSKAISATKYNQNEVKSQESIETEEDSDDTDDEDNEVEAISKKQPAEKKTANDVKQVVEDENDDDDDDEELPQEAGQLSGFVNFEALQNWVGTSNGNSHAELTANSTGLQNLQLTSNLKLGVESRFETEGNGQYLALESPSFFFETLTLSYTDELGGIGIGKFDHQYEDDLLNPIWDRQSTLFDNFPSTDLDVSEAIGLRAWLDLGNIIEMDTDHYLSGGVFFRDNTPLGRSIFTQYGRSRSDDNNLSNTGKFNSWTVSLHGDELPFAPGWEYAIGAVSQSPGVADLNRELSIYSGIYGDYELGNELEFSPMVEVLYRDGAEGLDQSAVSGLVSLSFEKGPWVFGASYSHRHLIGHAKNDATTDDNDAQLFASYYFDSGAYVDFGYQFLREDGETENALSLAVGIPFELSTNLYGEKKEPKKGLKRKDIKRIIRR